MAYAKQKISDFKNWTQNNFREVFVGSSAGYIISHLLAHSTIGTGWTPLFLTISTVSAVLLFTTIFFGVIDIVSNVNVIKGKQATG